MKFALINKILSKNQLNFSKIISYLVYFFNLIIDYKTKISNYNSTLDFDYFKENFCK